MLDEHQGNERGPSATPPSTSSELLAESLKSSRQWAREILGHEIKAFTVFLAATGAVLKFALDANATFVLRQGLAVFGLLLSVVGLLICYMAVRLRRALVADLSTLEHSLGAPHQAAIALPLKYMEVIGTVFACLLLAGWIWVLSWPPAPAVQPMRQSPTSAEPLVSP